MTPKENAKELLDKFSPIVVCTTNSRYDPCYDIEIQLDNAKKAALICVDEILYELNTSISCKLKDLEYWEFVKDEIKKL